MPEHSDGNDSALDDDDLGWDNLWCQEENTFRTNPVKVPDVVPGLWIGEFPRHTHAAPPSDAPLPDGWTKHLSKTKNSYYYFHKESGTTQWDFPKPKPKIAKPMPDMAVGIHCL